jgi:type I restriction enzyme S subunit
VARVGANAGFVHIGQGKYDVSDNTLIVRIKEIIILKYLYYLLVNMNLNQYAKGGGQPLITAGQLKSLQIPIPPLEEQNRIVSILDKFDALVNDISVGLPAEIKMRRQQYEYYRNELLTFKEVI